MIRKSGNRFSERIMLKIKAFGERKARPVAVQSKSGKVTRAKGKRAPGSRLTQSEVDEIFRRFQEVSPHPKTELHYKDPFTLLVAVVLSAQATDASVNRVTPDLFCIADTPETLAQLGEAGLEERIKTIGLFRNKAKNLVALSRKLVAEHGGKVPEDREVLMALPGVGRKTANVVLNTAFGQSTIGIDTHAFRVANRTGLAPGKTPLEVELKLERIVPERYKHNAHHWLILHGRYVCKAKRPECWRCIIADICLFKPKTPPPA
jgi:endonuclease-3